jgi:hypothetical protein
MKRIMPACLLGSVIPLTTFADGQKPTTVQPGTPVTITVKPAEPSAPDVSITLGTRKGVVTPTHKGCSRTGGGNIDVQTPSPDTIVVTMSGVAVAAGAPGCDGVAAMDFDLSQCFEINFDNPDVKAAKLTIEGRVIGLLRSNCKSGSADDSGSATVTLGPAEVVTLAMPGHSVCGGQSLSINDREGPTSVPVKPGSYTLHQTFHVGAQMKGGLFGKAPSAEFAPDPALDPLWISAKEPFHGAAKKDFGFQVTIKVAKEEVKEKK